MQIYGNKLLQCILSITYIVIHLSTARNSIIYSYFTQQNEYVANDLYLFYFVHNKMTNQLITLI